MLHKKVQSDMVSILLSLHQKLSFLSIIFISLSCDYKYCTSGGLSAHLNTPAARESHKCHREVSPHATGTCLH